MRKIAFPVSLFLLATSSAFAQTAALSRDPFVKACQLTPPNAGSHYPGADVVKFNNLLLPVGKSIPAEGQFVYLTGRVFDQRCVPLANAVVQLWQADARGTYRVPSRAEFASPYPLFAGSGEAVTDNNGRFVFYTVFPGPQGNRAPMLDFKVMHPKTRDLTTIMFFSGDARNDTDPAYSHLSPTQQPLVTGIVEPIDVNDPSKGVHVQYDITVVGVDTFRRF